MPVDSGDPVRHVVFFDTLRRCVAYAPDAILRDMRTRRALLASLVVVAVAVLTALSASAQSIEKLFFIQRSKNANEVHYDARVTKEGTLDPKDPVEGYWLNKAEDNSRKPISLIQRIAYGFDVSAVNGDGTHTMKLKAFPDRPLTLLRVDGRWRARVQIAGKQAYMTKLYVATDESGVMPTVLYVDVFGEEVGTGAKVQEHIKKN
jgi:hypothetical protein